MKRYVEYKSKLNNKDVTVIEQGNMMMRKHSNGAVDIGYSLTGDLYNFQRISPAKMKVLLDAEVITENKHSAFKRVVVAESKISCVKDAAIIYDVSESTVYRWRREAKDAS